MKMVFTRRAFIISVPPSVAALDKCAIHHATSTNVSISNDNQQVLRFDFPALPLELQILVRTHPFVYETDFESPLLLR
jgi:hypothetical protein